MPPVSSSIKTALSVVLGLIAVGIGLWLVNTYIPMANSIRTILNIFVVLATCVFVLRAVGLWSEIVRLWDNLTHHRLTQ
jgi:predicted membrane protein